MPSTALGRWRADGAAALDQLVSAHRAVVGLPGRRYATREINHAYCVMLASQFQRFCRDLHSETVDHLVAAVLPASAAEILRVRLLEGRKLDAGNANPSSLGSDFGRFKLGLWDAMRTLRKKNGERQERLQRLNDWRNAIAHQDFTTKSLEPPPPLNFRHVQSWRLACEALARDMDTVMSRHVRSVVGRAPW